MESGSVLLLMTSSSLTTFAMTLFPNTSHSKVLDGRVSWGDATQSGADPANGRGLHSTGVGPPKGSSPAQPQSCLVESHREELAIWTPRCQGTGSEGLHAGEAVPRLASGRAALWEFLFVSSTLAR